MEDNEILKTLRRFKDESGMDSLIDLRAVQAVGIVRGEERILRVWFNDGRIRDWDCGPMIRTGKGRFAELANGDLFRRAATVWDGAPGFDFSGRHDESGCLDFDPYEVWVEAKDVTRQVLEQERNCCRLLNTERGRLFSYREIFAAIVGEGYYADEGSLRAHICNLRKKLPRNEKIEAKRGQGYYRVRNFPEI